MNGMTTYKKFKNSNYTKILDMQHILQRFDTLMENLLNFNAETFLTLPANIYLSISLCQQVPHNYPLATLNPLATARSSEPSWIKTAMATLMIPISAAGISTTNSKSEKTIF